jgi:hypothetical protein
MRYAPRRVLGLIGLGVLIAQRASGQSGVTIQRARHDTLAAEPGSAVTFAFDVRNGGGANVVAEPHLVVPAGWSVVIGTTAFAIKSRIRDTWLIGVAPAPTAAPGIYVIRASLAVGRESTPSDSVLIRVPERHGLDVYPGEAPSFVMSGDDYPVRFFVHNRGNVAATIELRATTSLGSLLAVDPDSVTVEPGATATVSAHTMNGSPGSSTRECVVELTATDLSDSTVMSSASIRTTLVPRSLGWFDQFSTVPGQAMVRSVRRGSGVAPAALWGSGLVSPSSTTQLDFLFRAPVDGQPVFGERDEYHIGLTADNYRVRLGDNLFGFSQLTSSWTSGFGAEVRGEAVGLTAGAYVKRNRWNRVPGTERALELGTSPSAPVSASIVGVDRTNVGGPDARMGSFAAQARLGDLSVLEVEGAVSDSAGSPGEAHRARLSGDLSFLSYDLSLTHGTPEYAGRDRGQTLAHAGMTARFGEWASLSGNANRFSYAPMLSLVGSNQLESRNVEAGFVHDRVALGYEELTQRDSGGPTTSGASQRGLRFRSSIPLGPLDLSTSVAEGIARNVGIADHRYESITATLHARMGGAGSVELFGQRAFGTMFEMSGVNGGGSAMLRLPLAMTFSLSAYGSIPTGQSEMYFAQVDAELSHQLANGMAVVLRDRLTNYAWRTDVPRSNLFFLELRAPLRIPTGLTHTTGLARGQIIDQETGLGVSGALVRLGSEAAVSDARGRVTFASLAPGLYHASVDGASGPVMSDALLTGDVTVEVARDSREPVDFSLSLVRGGQVRVDVRQLDFATTLSTSSSDSLVDAGALANAMIALVGARDTIYQVTNQNGVATFRDVPVGPWSVKLIAGTLPPAHAVDDDEHAVTVRAGEQATVGFRIVPKRRAVQLLEPPPTVIARPAPPPRRHP